MKKGKYLAAITSYSYEERAGALSFKANNFIKKVPNDEKTTASYLSGQAPGVIFGYLEKDNEKVSIGVPQGAEGNILVVGGNGSGKSRGIAMPTLKHWPGTICATDLKGELSNQYDALLKNGSVVRPYLVFNPMQVDGPSYDPFWWLLEDDESNLMSNLWEIILAIIPTIPGDKQPFWNDSERAFFAASLLYFFKIGLGFSESICEIMSSPISSLCQRLSTCEDLQIKSLLGNPELLKSDLLASIDRGLRNKLMLFVSDPYVSHAFRGTREGARCFTWDDLNDTNIFLQIPADKIELWSSAINLMLTQLLHYLERRPEQYDPRAEHMPQTLLLLDEFARFGKLNMLPAAMATLRSKAVNICLLAQSIAQIDATYGEAERRILLDNCQYQAILRANDPETQESLCKLIGTRIQRRHNISQQLGGSSKKKVIGRSVQVSEVRDWMICPHELATLDDVLLLGPHGFLRVQKFGPDASNTPSGQFNNRDLTSSIFNKGAELLMIEDRTKNAERRIQDLEHRRRIAQKQANDNKRRQENLLKFFLGGLVLKYFPELSEITPGNTPEETQEKFQHVETILAALADRRDLVNLLQEEAHEKRGERISERADKKGEEV